MKNSTRFCRRGSAGAFMTGVLVIVVAVAVLGIQWYTCEFSLKQQLTTPLSRVAMSSNVQMASENLKDAIDYLERNHLTSGNSSMLFPDKLNDLEYFHTNLLNAQAELNRAVANKNMSQLEESNVLLRIKEVVTHHNATGEVFLPANLEYYPHQWGGNILMWGMIIVGFFGFCICAATLKD